MINIERTEVYGWESAIHGMRNPMNSWDKSDSCFWYQNMADRMNIGPNDLKLMKNLVKAGTDHSKFMRMIVVTCDITAPLYWWKEFDTYKVGTVRNSCSTMHTVHKKEFTLADFSCEHLITRETQTENERIVELPYIHALQVILSFLNAAREKYLETNDKKYWWQMIQLLPSSYNQKATVQMNYQVLRNMYHSRKNHKLDEWHDFCYWIESLPCSELIIE